MWEYENIIHLHNRNISPNTDKGKRRVIKEMAGLELLIQQGITGQWIINRLKELAGKMK